MLYPIITESRQVIDLNGIWRFKLDKGEGFQEKWFEERLTDTINMPVPYSYNDMAEDINLRDHIGWIWYEKEFIIQELMISERILLRFCSTTHTVKVYINGKLVTEHEGGFTPFESEINPFIMTGKNRLTVAVNNIIDDNLLPVSVSTEKAATSNVNTIKNIPNSDLFNHTGIRGPIKIYTTPDTYVKDISIVTGFQDTTGTVAYKIEVSGAALVMVKVLDEDDKVVTASNGAQGEITIQDVKLWEPLHAYLYTLRVELADHSRVVDVYELPFGIKTIQA